MFSSRPVGVISAVGDGDQANKLRDDPLRGDAASVQLPTARPGRLQDYCKYPSAFNVSMVSASSATGLFLFSVSNCSQN